MLHHETANPQMAIGGTNSVAHNTNSLHHNLVSPSAAAAGPAGLTGSQMMPAHHQHNHQAKFPSNHGDPANATAMAPPAGRVNNPITLGALSAVRRPPPSTKELCVEFDYTWPLNIDVLQAEGPKEPIACPEFSTCHNAISYKWQLLLYLSRPLSEFGEKYMGLYLCYKSGPVDFVSIDCEMFVSALDHSRACSNLARKVELEVEGRAWGYANFCPQDLGFLERRLTKAMLISADENELKIGVTIRMSTQYFNIRNFFGQFHPNKESERLSAYLFEKVCLDFDFGAERADCRIIASDGAGFYANRAVLEYASPVLQQLLTKTNPFVANEQSYNEITVDDLTSPALKEILHYVYKLSEKNAIQFLYTADTYQLPILLNVSLNMVIDRWPVLHASKDADKLLSDKVIVKKIMDGCSARANCHLNLVRLDTGLRNQQQQASPSQSLSQQQQSQLPAQQQQQQLLGSVGKTVPDIPTAFDDMYLYSLRGPSGAASELLQAYYPQTAVPSHQQQHMLVRRHGSEPQLQQLLAAEGPGADIGGIGYPIGRIPIIPPGTLQAGTAGYEAYQTLLNGTGLTSRQQQKQQQQQQGQQHFYNSATVAGRGGNNTSSSPRRGIHQHQQQQQQQQHATFSDMKPGQRSNSSNLPKNGGIGGGIGGGRVYQSIPRGGSISTLSTTAASGRSASAGVTPRRDVIDVRRRLLGGSGHQEHQENQYNSAPTNPMLMSTAGSAFKSVSASTTKRRRSGNASADNQYSRISSSQPGDGTLINMSSSSRQQRGGGPPGGSEQIKQKPSPLLSRQVSQQPTNLIAGLRSKFEQL